MVHAITFGPSAGLSLGVSSRVHHVPVPHLGPSPCDRITLEIRGLSPKIISDDSRRSENKQTQHIEAYNTIYEVHVKVITY
jgi:hypothetical protein